MLHIVEASETNRHSVYNEISLFDIEYAGTYTIPRKGHAMSSAENIAG